MAGRGRASGRGVVTLCLLLLVGLVGCGGKPATDRAQADVQRVLDRRARAVLDRDRAAFVRTGAQSWFTNLTAVPLADWSYRVTAVHRRGGSATADAELRYRVQGYDRAPVTVGRTLTLSLDAGGQWYVDAEQPAKKSAQQLWDQGEVLAVRGEHSLVLGVGQSGEQLHSYADLADRAVPAVSDAWGTGWPRQVVVLVPKSLQGMAGLLGSPASSYRGIAAVTTGETGAPAQAPADRIIVNPDAYGVLGVVGKQVVLTHETTHVATRSDTTPATPLWLSEGYADWVGYRGSGRTPVQAAPELWDAVTEGRPPAALPTDRDFGFSGDAAGLARAYEGGWMACRMIAERWGEARLKEFYKAVGGHEKRAGAVEDAMKEVLDTTPGEFTGQWRQYLRDQLS
ncbi:basic secretory family protein [Streptomyces sp. AC555_RSS877]|uniref:basic secretory family protein n=1 Tax=Streptomyces sp. AC555_RSS877 TaxID=2823688 RepID=UPI001C25D6DF|nr:basic secretory family protein [Streptomyces sp. AC555_RSS877]